jgi:hypothetical protein
MKEKDKPDNSQDLEMAIDLYKSVSGLEQIEDENPLKAYHLRRVKRLGKSLEDGEITVVVRHGRVVGIRKVVVTEVEEFKYDNEI